MGVGSAHRTIQSGAPVTRPKQTRLSIHKNPYVPIVIVAFWVQAVCALAHVVTLAVRISTNVRVALRAARVAATLLAARVAATLWIARIGVSALWAARVAAALFTAWVTTTPRIAMNGAMSMRITEIIRTSEAGPGNERR